MVPWILAGKWQLMIFRCPGRITDYHSLEVTVVATENTLLGTVARMERNIQLVMG